MDLNGDNPGFTEAELAYLRSGGEAPLPDEPGGAPANDPDAGLDDGGQPDAAAPVVEPAAAAPDADNDDPDIIEPGDENHRGRKVGYGAYLRKKQEADVAFKQQEELRARLNQIEQERAAERARIDERMRVFAEQQAAARAQQEPQQPQRPAAPPDPTEDPMGAINWLREEVTRLNQHTTQSTQQQQVVEQIRQLDREYVHDNKLAEQQMPEYTRAYDFLVNRARQLIALDNPSLTPQQIEHEVTMQERRIAYAARRTGKRPAQLILERAVVHGWRPSGQQAGQPQGQQQPQPDAAAQQAHLDQIARGQQANRSLSSTGRPPSGEGGMSTDRFMQMSDDQIAEWATRDPAGYERFLGQR